MVTVAIAVPNGWQEAVDEAVSGCGMVVISDNHSTSAGLIAAALLRQKRYGLPRILDPARQHKYPPRVLWQLCAVKKDICYMLAAAEPSLVNKTAAPTM